MSEALMYPDIVEIIESDLFSLVISNAFAYMTWSKDKEDEKRYFEGVPDPSVNFEDKLIAKDKVAEFKARLTEKDLEILKHRMSGRTYENIASIMGYANHSAIAKRIKKTSKSLAGF